MSNAQKYDDNKPPLALLSGIALEELGRVLAHGAEKYEEDNWRKGFEWRRLISASLRHILAFNDGEDKDPESGLSHVAHAMCMLMFLLEHETTHRDLDDRYNFNPIKETEE
jgi:hypothetical protein